MSAKGGCALGAKKIYLTIILVGFLFSFKASAATVSQVKKLKILSATTNSVLLQWKKISSAKYRIRAMMKDADGNFQKVKIVKTKKRKKEVVDLAPATTYYFKVRAIKNGKKGEYSKIKTITTLQSSQSEAEPAKSGTLSSTNSIGRKGAYYLPEGYNLEPKPLLVLYHGTDGTGQYMVNEFQDLAEEQGLIIVAADSRMTPTGQYSWEVGTEPGEITEDYTHVMNCIYEVDNMENVAFDSTHVLAAGHSGGASSAPYIATNQELFTAFGILHGGVFTGGLGSNEVAGWLSTGTEDTVRTPEMLEIAYQDLINAGYTNVVNYTFVGGHLMLDDEKSDLINWWLN